MNALQHDLFARVQFLDRLVDLLERPQLPKARILDRGVEYFDRLEVVEDILQGADRAVGDEEMMALHVDRPVWKNKYGNNHRTVIRAFKDQYVFALAGGDRKTVVLHLRILQDTYESFIDRAESWQGEQYMRDEI